MKPFEPTDLATADISYRAYGKSLEELFINSAKAIFSFITGSKIEAKETKKIETEAGDEVQLIHDWLGDVLKLWTIDRFLPAEFEVEIQDNKVVSKIRGEPFDESRHRIEGEIKAVTYHRLEIKKEEGIYSVEVVCDT